MNGFLFGDREEAVRCAAWLDRKFNMPRRGVSHYAPVIEHPATHAQWAIPIDSRAPIDEVRAEFPTAGGPDLLGPEWFPPPAPPHAPT